MSTETSTSSRSHIQSKGSVQRGRRTNRTKNRDTKTDATKQGASEQISVTVNGNQSTTANEVSKVDDDEENATCWICAEPVKFFSVSECNHRTCHVCALRLRALYKKMDCTFCKHPQNLVIFTESSETTFLSYNLETMPFKDAKLSVAFETQEMMEETMILLRFNCPDPECAYVATGWGDLKVHARSIHGKMMCDLCIRSKKVFAHEHALYSANHLYQHLPSLLHRSDKAIAANKIEGGVHPLCEFCRECFFSDDELFTHMRERHEECFVCKRNDIRDQYFLNYDSMEKHFNQAHFPCTQPHCLIQKFVVFGSAMDLQGHMVEEHGAAMSSRDKKDIRRVVAEFEFEEVASADRRRRKDGNRDQEREAISSTSRRPAIDNGRRREGFGSTLTVPDASGSRSSSPSVQLLQLSQRQGPPYGEDVEPVSERDAVFLSRVISVTSTPTSAAAIKAAVRSFRASESAARDLISTFYNVLERDMESTASLIIALVELLDDEDKRKDVLAVWNGFKIEQRREFPDLAPATSGSGYAGVAGGRVLNIKHSTGSRSSQQSVMQVWDRVARAAAASSSTPLTGLSTRPTGRFPTLQPSSSSAAAAVAPTSTPFRQHQYTTPWASSSTPKVNIAAPGPLPRIMSNTQGKAPLVTPPQLSNSAFPTLPPSSALRSKPAVSGNQSLRNIVGNKPSPTIAWNSAGRISESSSTPDDTDPSKPKKKKGKEKQTLFTIGAFPT